MIAERIRAVEDAAAAERKLTGVQVLGRRAVLSQKWNARPASCEAKRKIDPRIAARSSWSRIEALLRNRAFRDAYIAAREGPTGSDASSKRIVLPAPSRADALVLFMSDGSAMPNLRPASQRRLKFTR